MSNLPTKNQIALHDEKDAVYEAGFGQQPVAMVVSYRKAVWRE
jgi:hypothetical protein